MTSTERESEQARQLREGVQIVQPQAVASDMFAAVADMARRGLPHAVRLGIVRDSADRAQQVTLA